MGRRPYRSRRSTRSLDPSTNSDAVGLGVGPAATAFRWTPDFRALVVTFDANVVVTSGITARVRYTDSNGVNYICEGEATGSGSTEVAFPMIFDRSNPTPTPGLATSSGIGNACKGTDGLPVQEFYSASVTEDVGSSGPKIVAAFFEDGSEPVLTCIFNMAVNCEDTTSDIFVYSQLAGATLQPDTTPIGHSGGTAMLRWTSFATAGDTPPGTIKVIGATSSIIGDANSIEMSNLSDYPFTPGPPFGIPGPSLIGAQWDNDAMQMQLTFDQDVVPVGDIVGKISFKDANGVGWTSSGIEEVADETVIVQFAWANTFNEVTTASSSSLGAVIHSQITGAPANDFTQFTVNDGGDVDPPQLVHASYTVADTTLRLYFNQEMSDDSSNNDNIVFHFPAGLGDATKSNTGALSFTGGIVSCDAVTHSTAIVTDAGTTAANPDNTNMKGANNAFVPDNWSNFPVTIIE